MQGDLPHPQAVACISDTDGCVCTDRTKRILHGITEGANIHARCRTPRVGEVCELEVYEERNLIEIFVNDGQYVMSNVLYPCE